MLGAHGHGLSDFLVHDTVDLHTLLGLSLQDSVQTPFRVGRGGTTKVQLGSEPPILYDSNNNYSVRFYMNHEAQKERETHENEDGFTCTLQHL